MIGIYKKLKLIIYIFIKYNIQQPNIKMSFIQMIMPTHKTPTEIKPVEVKVETKSIMTNNHYFGNGFVITDKVKPIETPKFSFLNTIVSAKQPYMFAK